MALYYKNLWKLLIDRDMTRKDLHRVSGVSHVTLAKMSRGESVTASVLDRICNSLDCKIENVMEITPDRSIGDNEEDRLYRNRRASRRDVSRCAAKGKSRRCVKCLSREHNH